MKRTKIVLSEEERTALLALLRNARKTDNVVSILAEKRLERLERKLAETAHEA